MLEKTIALLSGVLMPFFLFVTGGYFLCTVGRRMVRAPKKIQSGLKEASGSGGSSPWRTLSLSLAGTLGVGNITGVALAVFMGGAGAVFWLWMSAIVAMFLKYAEILLAVKTRKSGADGRFHGGAMYYIREAMGGKVGRALAYIFSVLCIFSAFTLGGVIQTASAAEAMESAFDVEPLAVGVSFALLAAIVLWKGVGGVERVSAVLVPVLCAVFSAFSIYAVFLGRARLPSVFSDIFHGAFTKRAGASGVFGFLFTDAFRFGVARGLVSNEAGCGTSPIAHAGSAVESPAAQGVFGLIEVFVDTLLLCTLTALVLLTSGVAASEGSDFAVRAYTAVFGELAAPLLAVSITLFAFATVICWAHYGQECLSYFSDGAKYRAPYIALFCLFLAVGTVAAPRILWSITDLVLALLTLINLLALILCRKTVLHETEHYFKKEKAVRASARTAENSAERERKPSLK